MNGLLRVLTRTLTLGRMARNLRRHGNPYARRQSARAAKAPSQKLRVFADLLRLEAHGGRGGSGCHSALRTRARVTGGWNGGDGGPGGDVVVEAAATDPNLGTKKALSVQGNVGGFGRSKFRPGIKGRPVRVFVPLGTTVSHVFKDAQTGEEVTKELGLLARSGESVVVARGGRGGLGTADRRFAPERQAGLAGERRTVELSLSIPHDVSLLGFGRAGKSTLLAALTNVAAPRSDTREPSFHPALGRMKFIDERSLTLLDFPPFAPAAEQPRIHAFRWAKHLRSSRVLLFVLDAGGPRLFEEVQAQLQFVRDNDLLARRLYFAANKIEAADAQRQRLIHRFFGGLGLDYACLSLETTLGLNKIAADLHRLLPEPGGRQR